MRQRFRIVPGETSSMGLRDRRVKRTLTHRHSVSAQRSPATAHQADPKTLAVHVKRLRSKPEDDPHTPTRIVTIRGLGYKYDSTLASAR